MIEEDEEQCDCDEEEFPPPLQHKSLSLSRQKNNVEEYMVAKVWEEENTKHRYVERILGQSGVQATQRDAQVIAEMIQWFATNVGVNVFRDLAKANGFTMDNIVWEDVVRNKYAVERLYALEFIMERALRDCRRWCFSSKDTPITVEEALTSHDVTDRHYAEKYINAKAAYDEAKATYDRLDRS